MRVVDEEREDQMKTGKTKAQIGRQPEKRFEVGWPG